MRRPAGPFGSISFLGRAGCCTRLTVGSIGEMSHRSDLLATRSASSRSLHFLLLLHGSYRLTIKASLPLRSSAPPMAVARGKAQSSQHEVRRRSLSSIPMRDGLLLH